MDSVKTYVIYYTTLNKLKEKTPPADADSKALSTPDSASSSKSDLMIRLKALVAKKKEARLGQTGRSETSSPAGSAASTPREKDPKPEDGPKKGDGPEEGDGPKKGEDGPAPEPIEIPPMPSKDDVMALAKVYADVDGKTISDFLKSCQCF